MNTFSPKQILAAALIAAAPAVFAAVPVIGVAVSQGNIVVDSRLAPGSASIFEGGLVQTGDAPSQIRLKNGGQLRLGANSRAKIFGDHAALEKGSASVSGVEAVANGLRVRPETSAMATVTVGEGVLQVASVTGAVHVFNADGVNVANVASGRILNLSVKAGTQSSSLIGCAVRDNENLLLTDETSGATVRLGGEAIHTGKRVLVTGTVSAVSGKVSVLKVASVKELNGPCAPASPAPVLTASAASLPASAVATSGSAVSAGGSSAGAAIGTTTAIIASTSGFGQASTIVAGVTATGTTTAIPTTDTSNSASGTSGGLGTGTGGVPKCLSPCTF